MKMIVRRTVLAVCTLVLALILPTAASAACAGFDDVPETADCYESVMYLAEHKITQGTGNGCFSPDAPVTTSQWAVMLCRAYGVETNGSTWSELRQNAVEQSYRKGWLNETALSALRSPMCRSVLVESAFAAADVPVYDSTLYEGGASLSTADNILRVGRELGLCSDDADTNALVTRGDAAIILHVVLTQSFRIEAPPAPVALVNAAGVNINDYLLALRQVPEPVRLESTRTDPRCLQRHRLDVPYRLRLHQRTQQAAEHELHWSHQLQPENHLHLRGQRDAPRIRTFSRLDAGIPCRA